MALSKKKKNPNLSLGFIKVCYFYNRLEIVICIIMIYISVSYGSRRIYIISIFVILEYRSEVPIKLFMLLIFEHWKF